MVIQLDTKTVYSFMDSLIPIKKYVQKARELGYSHLGMMDVDNLYGAYHFLEETESADQGRAGASSPSAGLRQSGLSQSDEGLDSQDDGTKKMGGFPASL